MSVTRKGRLCVNVGCWSHPIAGWKNYDNNIFVVLARIKLLRFLLNHFTFVPESYKDFMENVVTGNIRYADVSKRIPEEENSVDVLYSSHMLEHLDKEETHCFLIEARRVLVPGGIIRTVVPDFDRLVEKYVANNKPQQFIDDSQLVGLKPKTILKKLQYFSQGHGWHHCMYNRRTLSQLFHEYGFSNIKILEAGETGIGNTNGLDLSAHLGYSIYLEAQKDTCGMQELISE